MQLSTELGRYIVSFMTTNIVIWVVLNSFLNSIQCVVLFPMHRHVEIQFLRTDCCCLIEIMRKLVSKVSINRQHGIGSAIIWHNDGLVYWGMFASLSLGESRSPEIDVQ